MRRGHATPKLKAKSGFTPILIIPFLIIILLAGLVYWRDKNSVAGPIGRYFLAHPEKFTPVPLPTNEITDETANWEVLGKFKDLNGNQKFIISRLEPVSDYPDLSQQVIYFSENEFRFVNHKKIIETGSQSSIKDKPSISTNEGKKFIAFQLFGSGDVNESNIFDEKGEKIILDLSKIDDEQLTGTSSFIQWINNTTEFKLILGSFGPNDHELLFDATTGKQVGEDKLIPN